MKKKYRKIENNINYLVIESNNYFYLRECEKGNIKDFDYKKIIIADGRNETFYFYKHMMHNLYGPAWSRLMCKDEYWIFGVKFDYDKWYIIKNYILRKEKLLKLKKLSET